MDIQAQLQTARHRLQQLGESLTALVADFPQAFADGLVQQQLADFRHEHQESTERLAHPRLVIATLGTTSAGKSTIVNALIGRRLAPIEAGEMSGGVLRLVHAEERRLVIAETPESAWETGTWDNPTDKEMYDRIQATMQRYHETRKRKDLMAPQIQVWAPLLPACDPGLSGLPAGLGVEFLDLPGLKSVQDRANLAVIQPQMGKAVSLVALDYQQVDEQHRQRLLEELKEVVQYFQGRTESMIFVLNRVDVRGSDDWPLEKRLQTLRKEIKETLSLPDLPDVIPFSARLLYYAQCAWGTRSLTEAPTTSKSEQIQLLKNLFRDCASILKEKQKPYPKLKERLRDIEDRLEDSDVLDDLNLKALVRLALEWSGGTELWKCLGRRLQESFADVVVAPALLKTLSRLDTLMSSLDVILQNRTKESQIDIEKARANISQIRAEMQAQVRAKGQDFKKKIERVIEASRSPDKLGAVTKEVGEGFGSIVKIVTDVEGDLVAKVIAKVRDALERNESAYRLEEVLTSVVSPSVAKDLARAYDNASRCIAKLQDQEDGWYRQVRADDNQGKQELEHAEKHFRLLYYTVRSAIQQRAEFLMQAKIKDLEKSLTLFVDDQFSLVGQDIKQKLARMGNTIDAETLIESILGNLSRKLADLPVNLPAEIFQFTDTVLRTQKKQREVVGQESYVDYETYETGSCWKKQETKAVRKVRDQYGDVEYVALSLPKPKSMARDWANGIAQARLRLWEILQECLKERLQTVEAIFAQSLDEITGLANRALDEQSQAIEADFAANQKYWQSFAERRDRVKEIRSLFGI